MATEEVKSQENPYEVHVNSVNNLGQGMPTQPCVASSL